jgi:lactase-phlorizin hydrolase
LNINWCQPFNATNADHIQASMTQLQFWGGWFANPIFVNGQYPDVMREKVKEFKNT